MVRFHRVVRPCNRQGWNGPAGFIGKVGHKLSAIGSPHHTACSSGFPPHPAQLAAHLGRPQRDNRHASDSQVLPPAYPRPFRTRLSPSLLAHNPSRQMPLDGKVRGQKRFAFPVRRMKRGSQSSKTINSRKFITNAKTSTRWRGPFTTAASHGCCRACSPHLWTWAWSGTRFCM